MVLTATIRSRPRPGPGGWHRRTHSRACDADRFIKAANSAKPSKSESVRFGADGHCCCWAKRL